MIGRVPIGSVGFVFVGPATEHQADGAVVRAAWLALGALVLTACAETTIASSPPEAEVVPEPVIVTTIATTTTTTTTTTLPPTTTTTTTQPPLPPVDPPIQAVGRSNGEDTRLAQQRLLDLGFWLQEADGGYGTTTRQAVMAFQKYYGITADGSLGPETAELLSSTLARPTARADAGTLVEIDKGKQVLFFVIDGQVEWVLNVSTGSEIPYTEPDQNTPGAFQSGDSITRNGLHSVYRQRSEGWWEGDLGRIYRPKYFTGGIAVHGSNHIPNYPASHGCVRVSVPAMDWIWESGVMPMDIPVWVHEGQ